MHKFIFLNKNIILLLLGQGFSGAVVSLLTFSSGLAGKWLLDGVLYSKAPSCPNCYSSSFATFPISATLCGAFIAVLFSSNLMQKFGKKKVFLWASLIGALGAIFAIFSLINGLFYLFCFATFLLGFFTALNQFYRFLASEALSLATQNDKNRATALIVAGGIMGGVLGPNLANIGTMMFEAPFAGSFLFALLLCVINFIITLPLALTPLKPTNQLPKAPLMTCIKEPNFILATMACAFVALHSDVCTKLISGIFSKEFITF
ncbi:MFS transporter [Campylobacter iguaniorum]|uniref:MFS transporter n=1 Tax=Campylobacter iguaniorum TaxID=1244531 RepID=UPI000A7AB50B|nr:MFS transporter [Campylobacter iguaniorum]